MFFVSCSFCPIWPYSLTFRWNLIGRLVSLLIFIAANIALFMQIFFLYTQPLILFLFAWIKLLYLYNWNYPEKINEKYAFYICRKKLVMLSKNKKINLPRSPFHVVLVKTIYLANPSIKTGNRIAPVSTEKSAGNLLNTLLSY